MNSVFACLLYGGLFAVLANLVGVTGFWKMEALLIFSLVYSVIFARLQIREHDAGRISTGEGK